ncbi:MAG: glycoside hydrolase family 66 protein [Paenibacillaceae bacterium]
MQAQIIDVYPTKAQFISGEEISIIIELENTSLLPIDGLRYEAKLVFGDQVIAASGAHLELSAEVKEHRLVIFPAREAIFDGLGVDVKLYTGDHSIQEFSSSLDVVSDWRRSMRYGFLSDFYKDDIDDRKDLESLNKLHLNLIQFYDWMYRHDELLPPADEFTDLMGRTVRLDAVREKITACHLFGMKAMAYGAVYAASREFYEQHPDWALYNSAGNVVDFIGIFRIMNIEEQSPWHQHIIDQYRRAIVQLDFDGIHMDTYGFPKAGFSRLDANSEYIRLKEHFPKLINNTRTALSSAKDEISLIFNNVGNWPVDATAPADQDAIYIEVWKPYERYHHLRELIRWAKNWGPGKPVILAAYLSPFREQPVERTHMAETSALLLTAVIVSGGGYHLLHGEKNGVLTQGYYVDYSQISNSFMREIRNYYDFMIRYANHFYDDTYQDVSMTHTDGDNLEYIFEGFDYSTYGEPDKVWVTMKENSEFRTINFINLMGISNDKWNEGKETSPVIGPLTVSMQIDQEVATVYYASPDQHMGRPQHLPYSIESGERGNVMVLQVPQLSIWSLLVIQLNK